MRITFIGQIENKKTGLGKALNDIIAYSSYELGDENLEQIDITNNSSFFNHVFRILTSNADVFYFTPSGSKLGILRDSLYLLAMNLKKKKVVCHFHNSNFGNTIKSSFILSKISKKLYDSVSDIILLGSKQKEMFTNLELVDEKFKIIHNGVDDYLFVTEGDILKKQSDNIKKVIYFSNMLPEKGYQAVLESAEELQDREDLFFYFSGKFFDENLEEEFLKRSAHLKNVEYISGVYGQEKKDLLQKMNIFILPSLYKDETLPISMLEAMASGCYIIVSDVGVISEVVNLETTTLLSTDELNSKDISRTILQVLPSLSELDYHVDLMKNNFDNKQVQKRIFNVIVS